MFFTSRINFKVNYQIIPGVYFLASWIIVGFGQPAWSPLLSIVASICGYVFFWRGLEHFSVKRTRFWISIIWFMAVESIHLSWMTAIDYQGYYIYVVYLSILFLEGLQFGVFSRFLKPAKRLSWTRIGFLSGLWVLMEWSRLFFICGFPFNPVGLTLSSTLFGLQNASIAGVYGLSFWVILTNLAGYKYFYKLSDRKLAFIYSSLILLPYLFGGIHLNYHLKKMGKQAKHAATPIKAILVQTGLTPTEKSGFRGFDKMLPPIEQWALIYQYVASQNHDQVDLIALPENTVPLANNTLFYFVEDVKMMILSTLGEKGLVAMPKLDEGIDWVDNMYLSQILANYFQAQVIVGLENVEGADQKKLLANASAFCFAPNQSPQIYHKRVLLPVVEYIPFEWCKNLARRYDICGWYEPGRSAAVFDGKLKISPSICMEEMYSYIVRHNRSLGGEVFVNITNDVWYPNSKLPQQHFDHGILRAVENGVPVFRACNTGVTGAVNALGQTVGLFKGKNLVNEWARGAMYVEVSNYHFTTLYSILGDYFILGLSLLLMVNFIFSFSRTSRQPYLINNISHSSIK